MRRLIAALLCSLVLSAAPVAAQAGPGAGGSPDAGTFQLEPVKQLRKDVDLWPLIVQPRNPAGQRVNATLTQLNRRVAQAVKQCDADALAWSKQMGETTKGNDTTSAWSRKVQVTMAGPQFLSLVASDEAFCGGAHPNSDQMALVFDMSTGAPVNWTALVAKSTGASSYTDTIMDGSTVGALILPALQKMNIAAADASCKDAFADPQSFLLWPDAKSDTLVAQPFDLPQAVQACAQEIHLTIEQARNLGFSESLLSAIEQAHRAIVAAPQR
jgi:hypothetical protein